MKRASLYGHASPHTTALPPRMLVRAAWLIGRGFPLDEAAERLDCCPRKLRVELDRLGVDRMPARPGARGAHSLTLSMPLSPAERVTLGSAAIDHCLYEPAVGTVLLRTILRRGRAAVDALLSEGGAR